MAIWKKEFKLEDLTSVRKETMTEHLGIHFTEVGEDYLVATMPIDERTIQPYGIMHGGAACALAETVGSVAANLCLEPGPSHCVGLDINVSHLRMVRSGHVKGVARPVHIGRTTQVWEVRNYDDKERLVSLVRLTMMVLSG